MTLGSKDDLDKILKQKAGFQAKAAAPPASAGDGGAQAAPGPVPFVFNQGATRDFFMEQQDLFQSKNLSSVQAESVVDSLLGIMGDDLDRKMSSMAHDSLKTEAEAILVCYYRSLHNCQYCSVGFPVRTIL